MARLSSFALMLMMILMLGACAAKHAPDPDSAFGEQPIPDPLEPFNRPMFRFNDWFITDVFGPVRTVYVEIFPQDLRNGFSNFYRNLATPVRTINSILQLKADKALAEVVRFVLNTTFGTLGLFDVTRNIAWLNPSPEDFGQTLGHAGAGYGAYLVLPFLGPTSVRDAIGTVADSVAHPLFWCPQLAGAALPMGAHDRANALSQYFDEYQKAKADAFDPYISFKDIYTQHRDALVRQ